MFMPPDFFANLEAKEADIPNIPPPPKSLKALASVGGNDEGKIRYDTLQSTGEPTTRLLFNAICKRDKNYNQRFHVFLKGTIQSSGGSTSHVSALRGFHEPLQCIRSYLKPKVKWNKTITKVSMNYCAQALRYATQGSELATVEALDGYGGGGTLALDGSYGVRYDNDRNLVEDEDGEYDEPGIHDEDGGWHHGKGSLCTPIRDCFVPLKTLIGSICEDKNPDGSYLSEMQIRERYYQHMSHQCPGERYSCCNRKSGMCGVLPGDTVFWEEIIDTGEFEFSRFEPASIDELVERGYNTATYSFWAECFRKEKSAERIRDQEKHSQFQLLRESFEFELRQKFGY